MAKPRVLLDTNILVSGLVFAGGKEHKILRLAEERKLQLVIPEPVIYEVEQVLTRKFFGFRFLFDLYLERVESETVEFKDIEASMTGHAGEVRDEKDLPIFTAALLVKPDYVVTGDKALREDMKNSEEIAAQTKVLSSSEFLAVFELRYR